MKNIQPLKFFNKINKINNLIIKSIMLLVTLIFIFFLISIYLICSYMVSKEINFIIGIVLITLSAFTSISFLISCEKIIQYIKNVFIIKLNKKEIQDVIPTFNIKEYKNKKEDILLYLFKNLINHIEGTEAELIEAKNIIESFKLLEKENFKEYFDIIDILIKKYSEKINLENFLVKNKILNQYEVIFLNLLNKDQKLINKILDYLEIDQILNNNEILEKVNMDYIYQNLKNEFKLEDLIELMFEKENTKFIDKEYDLNIWNFLHGSNFSKILELKKLILEDIIESENEFLIMNYKDDFLDLVEDVKCKNLDKLFVLKQKLKKIKIEDNEFKIIHI